MLVLAFDTATPAVTAALHDGRGVVAESTTIDARRHGELLAPAIEEVLRKAGVTFRDVTVVVAGAGPGPYTGLRVGLVTATALAMALGVPALGVCTLDALAYAADLPGPFLVATDARRKEVFWARYADRRTRVAGPYVDRPHALPGELPVVGAGGRLYAETIGPERITGPEYPSAGALAALAAEHLATLTPEEVARLARVPEGRVDSVEQAGELGVLGPARPIYLRRPDARVPGAPKRVTR
ncbi:tRNA (adenosine(37)-N6)-threonylcarbamoyltransferase complex dimerization subunit type 1 TsaB [Thermobispora bispora]|uniref:Peptidase M22 glycoprotease n=1 Tax=Thermobispora bispora (strain ATCC 19993 / DSM 43833 / CBS 139.67 / JCM 10125 / KCTC 9307 / NBRC 14880 / R51) TaxID=469371 RepID=D6Y566_THEBD|nr:tRNA (adenosine(37)-N6)-threonylcarbamoyltransferase complex dimerization subunit type 1 TsaB [Thermobispora bispora]MBO2475610.1 tRNA (adenosine(37)-N6)-threonylcarbamoyltransferase complex dimerization subunit type 1 TsaB [Actinomycetales bacterium]MDI9580155.1 tRNA (adenosine(37)-N6)-threonylcarbamoyltransferase complex dimerization subunit type 1 TsaB [Thermobispora sp.]ADG87341.1 peptidase M22 glycoprotease [Thermobispora bispora DSM 43833]MBX6166448.1 tRNA (adenosine(37)-N6)-threonylca